MTTTLSPPARSQASSGTPAAGTKPAVEIEAITKTYLRQRGLFEALRGQQRPSVRALDGVSFRIEEGEVFGLLGPNGSGKTTLLKILSTILSPTDGTARIFGVDVRQDARRVRQLVALVTAEERSLYWRLTGRQNLTFFSSLYRNVDARSRQRNEELLELFDLRDAGDTRVGEYSTGMRQKLAIVRGLLSEPRLLFLDEPTRGLDPAAAHNLLALVRERAVEHLQNTVILTTHIAREVEQLCDRIATLHRGRVSYLGSVEGLAASVGGPVAYTITVVGATDTVGALVTESPGIIDCQSTTAGHGVVDLDVSLTDAAAITDVLRRLLGASVTITRCQVREQSIEDTFRAVFDRDASRLATPPSTRPR